MKEALAALDRLLSWLESVLIVVFTMSALVLGVTQVILRYGFNMGITWAETVFVMLTAAGMMIAGSRAVRNDNHVRVEIVYDLFPAAWRRGLDVTGILISLALCAYYAVCGWFYVVFLRMIEATNPATGLSDWIFYLLVPITFGMFSLRYVIRLVLALSGAPLPAPHHQAVAEAELQP
ncbi:TRAP transporter small permease subunit [Aquabacter sp. CN5-332]|uniref:TRAP transporter small permease n=1 Tax=Aquabacter sp. CN5-332 TaxID=3156608 RepID=UPI0032B4B621